jgi:hypothetical protein
MIVTRIHGLVLLLAACAEPQGPVATSPTTPVATPASAPAPTPTTDNELRHALNLPASNHAGASPFEGTTQIVLSRGALRVDGEPAGDVSEVLSMAKLRRLDVMFERLKSKRATWKAQHPGADFCGCATLWVDQQTPLLVFKSVFQTVAFAGYPKLQIAVKVVDSSPARTGYLNFGASVPLPPRTAPDDVLLHIDYLESGKVQLAWRTYAKVLRSTELDRPIGPASPQLAPLRELLATEWRSYGGHQSAQDSAQDQAVIHLPSSLDVAAFTSLLDTIHGVQRDLVLNGAARRVPAFDVTFPIN